MVEKSTNQKTDTIRDEFTSINDAIELWDHYNRNRKFYRSSEAVQFLVSNLPINEKPENLDDKTRNMRLNAVLLLDAIGKNSISAVNVLKVIANDSSEDRLMRSICQKAADSIAVAFNRKINISAPLTEKHVEDVSTAGLNVSDTSKPKKRQFGQDENNEKKVDSIAVFISRVQDRNETIWRRSSSARALGHLGAKSKDAIPLLADLLKDPTEDDQLRITCADALGKMAQNDPKIINLLLKCLRETSEPQSVRKACADALGKIGITACKSVPTLTRTFKSSGEDSELRIACVKAISNMGPDSAKSVLSIIRIIKSNNEPLEIRIASLETLEKIGPYVKFEFSRIESLSKIDCDELKDKISNAIKSVKAAIKK